MANLSWSGATNSDFSTGTLSNQGSGRKGQGGL